MDNLLWGKLILPFAGGGFARIVVQRRPVFLRPFSNDRDHRFHDADKLIGIA
jgi:hypothetical protein